MTKQINIPQLHNSLIIKGKQEDRDRERDRELELYRHINRAICQQEGLVYQNKTDQVQYYIENITFVV